MRGRLSPALLLVLAFGCSSSPSPGPSQPTEGSDASAAPDAGSTTPADASGGGNDATVDGSGGSTTPDASNDATTAEHEASAPVDSGGTDAGAAVDTGAADAAPGDAAVNYTGGGLADGGFTLPITNAGCGKANPPTGSQNLTIAGAQANYIVTLPNGYSPTTPVPLVFGFHGRNRTNADFENVDALDIKTEIAPFAIIVYPQSQGGPGWEMTNELPVNITFFEALWTQMFSNYCVDSARVFVMGHSSGAIFSNILGCRYGDRVRGVGAVASALPENACVGDVAAMLVHGGEDPVIPLAMGEAARDFWLQRSGCSMTSMPGEVAPCVAYEGCLPNFPVEWCQHTEPTYTMTDGGGHGYPTFASKAIWHFFSALKPKNSP